MPDILSQGSRSQILEEIIEYKNREYKSESLRRFEIYSKRPHQYIIEKLKNDLSPATVKEMRVISSINLAPRIVDEIASIYKEEPMRNYENLSDDQVELLNNWYFEGQYNDALKRANRYFTFDNQCALQVLPKVTKKGVFLEAKPLLRFQYDVIPRDDDPERPFAYIKNVFDKILVSPVRGSIRVSTRNNKVALNIRDST